MIQNENNFNENDIKRLKRELILLKRKRLQVQFKNSPFFKVLSIINIFILIIYIQFILSYILDLNTTLISNQNIDFKTYPYESGNIKLYNIIFHYKNYFFRVKINKELDQTIMYSDAIITRDNFFQIPQKLKFINLNNKWFLVNESLGILTICAIIVFTQSIAYFYKQNEYLYPLLAISFLSIISFIGISIFSLFIHNFI